MLTSKPLLVHLVNGGLTKLCNLYLFFIMTTTYNPNQSTSLLSPDQALVVNFEPASLGMVDIQYIEGCFGEQDTTECYYTNDAKSLFYSYVSKGYSIL